MPDIDTLVQAANAQHSGTAAENTSGIDEMGVGVLSDGDAEGKETQVAALDKVLGSGKLPAREADELDEATPKPTKKPAPTDDEPDEMGRTPSRSAPAAEEADGVEEGDATEALIALADEYELPADQPPAAKPAAKPAHAVDAQGDADLLEALEGIKQEVSPEGAKPFEKIIGELSQSRKVIAELRAGLDEVRGSEAARRSEAEIPKLREFHKSLNDLNPRIFGTIDFDKARAAALAKNPKGIGAERHHVAARQFVHDRVKVYRDAGANPERVLARAVEDLEDKIGVKITKAKPAPKPSTQPTRHAPARAAQPPMQRRTSDGQFTKPASEEEGIARLARELGIPE